MWKARAKPSDTMTKCLTHFTQGQDRETVARALRSVADVSEASKQLLEALQNFDSQNVGSCCEAPANFVPAAESIYLQAVQDPRYYFSCEEIALMARQSQLNLVIVKGTMSCAAQHPTAQRPCQT